MKTVRPIKVIIADNHEIFRELLGTLLTRESKHITVIKKVANGVELVNAVKELQPDVAIVDLRMPVKDGFEAIKEITAKTSVRCIATSVYENKYYLAEALQAGALGFVYKSAEKGAYRNAVYSASKGLSYFCKAAANTVRIMESEKKKGYSLYKRVQFTDIEIKIILLVCQEYSSKEISDRLFMGKRNVDHHRAIILHKMKVKTTAGMLSYALQHKLFTLNDLAE